MLTTPILPRRADSRTLWWGTVGPTDVLTLGRAAADAGFDSIAVTPAMVQALGSQVPGVREVLTAMGVTVTLIDPLVSALPGSPHPDEVPERFRRLFAQGETEAYTAAEAFDADVCVGGFLGRPVSYEEVLAGLRGLAERAAARSLRILIEFMPGTQIPDLPTALRLLDDLDAQNLGLIFDTWHFARLKGTTDQLDLIPEGAVTVVQLADRDRRAHERPHVPMEGRLMPGQGDLPLREWLARVLESSPHADVGVEVFNDAHRSQDPADIAAASARSLATVSPARLQ